ncbi:MAG: phenylalanine--tRNA ligase subunit beta [Parcubacteria group bacterium]
MKLSYNWLAEFVPLDLTPQKLADLITMKAAEVESLELLGQTIKKVIVGEILEIRPHPKATKLQLAKVSTGKDTLEVVCGAKNIRVGQKVPLAGPGATLPGGLKIAAREIRGIKSEGMLCSPGELGLAGVGAGEGAGDGILILDPTAEVGADVRKLLGLEDAIIDIKVLPDRSYLLSHVGVARDISAMRAKTLLLDNYGKTGADAITHSQVPNNGSVKILDQVACPRYSMIMLSNLRVGPSPAWLATRLQHLGVRPVNNLVDLTNYIMLELGQPLHAFDQAKLHSHKIVVRRAKAGESITTIDGEVRQLEPDMLVIADQGKVLALAGLMGGKESEITNLTSGALIESANFDPKGIRATAQRLHLRTDASMRYERGVDPNLTAVALARLVELLPKVGLVEAQCSQIIDDYPAPLVRQPVRFNPTQVKRLTGVDIPFAEQIRLLQGLGMALDDRNFATERELFVTPPSFRQDVTTSADIVEEITRLYGYERIPLTLPNAKLVPQPYDVDRHWSRRAKNLLRGARFSEIETYSFVSRKMLLALQADPREHIALENPMSSEQAYLRSSLIPNALAVIQKNIALGRGAMHFYELGRTFRMVRGKPYPFEPLMLTVLVVSDEARRSKPRTEAPEWAELASVLDLLLYHLGLEPKLLKRKPFSANPAFHHGRTALLELNGEDIGYLAEVHPGVLATLDINRYVAVLDLEFYKLMAMAKDERRFTPIAKYPAVRRDLSLVADETLSAAEIIATITKSGGELLQDIELFDRYRGPKLDAGKKSYAFHLEFRSDKESLSDKAIAPLLQKINQALTAKKITLR